MSQGQAPWAQGAPSPGGTVEDQRHAGSFGVLAVCRANHCRSPLIEHVLRSQAALRGLRWDVLSAGLFARSGVPMHPRIARILARRGISATEWRSRSLVPGLVTDAQLILVASEAHRSKVLQLEPRAMNRTFTLREFAYLARAAEPQDVPADGYGPWLVKEVRWQRTRLPPLAPPRRDLADPMGRSFLRFHQCARTVDKAVEDILAPWTRAAAG